MLKRILFCAFLFFFFQGKAQSVSLFADPTDCTTFGVCDGEFTVWVEGAIPPFQFTFEVTGPGGPYSQTVNDTIYTFTGLCPGDYTADMFWDTTNVSYPYPDSCTNCTGGGGGGGGGASASGTVAQPCENPIASPIPDVLHCPGFTNMIPGVNLPTGGNIVYTWSYTFDSNPTVTGTGSIPSLPVPNPIGAGPYIVDVTATMDVGNGTFCTQQLTYNIVVGTYSYYTAPDLTICEGESIWINCGGWLSAPGGATPTNPVSPSVTTEYTCGYPVTEWSCGGASWQTVIVIPNPEPDAGPDITVCEGESVILNGTGGGTLTWDNGVANGTSVSPPLGTTQYVLFSDNGNGCVSTDTMEITVVPEPVMNPVQDVYACEGEMIWVGFSLSTPSGGLPIEYNWDGSNNWSIGLQQSGSGDINGFIPNTFGQSESSTITVTPTLNGVCVGQPIQFTIWVEGVPTVDAGPDITICEGEEVTLVGSIGGFPTNDWYAGFWSPWVDVGVPFTPISTTTYTLFYDNWACPASDQVTVTVLPNPAVDAGPDITVCEGESVTLNASGTGTITWSNGVMNGDSFIPIVGLQELIVESVQTNGCSTSDTLILEVLPIPTVDAGPDIDVCETAGQSVMLMGSASTTATWSGFGSYPNPAMVGFPLGSYVMTLTATGTNGCSASDDMLVIVNPSAQVWAGDDVVVCEGDSVTLVGTVYQANATSWSGSVPVVDGVPFLPPPGTSYYTFNGLDLVGNCSTFDDLTITVLPGPNVNAGGDATICLGDSVLLNATGSAQSYMWNVGSANGDYYTPPAGTNQLIVEGYASNGCLIPDTAIVTVLEPPTMTPIQDLYFCEGENFNISFSVQSNPSGLPVTYNWSGTDNWLMDIPASGSSSNLTGVIPVLSSGGNNTITVTPMINGSCEGTPITFNVFIQIQVIEAALPDMEICSGDSVVLPITVYNAVGTEFVNNVPFYPTQSGEYVPIWSGQPCSSVEPFYITVNPGASANAGLDEYICEGTSYTLSGVGAGTLTWNGALPNGANVTPGLGSNEYILTSDNGNGCLATDTLILTGVDSPVMNSLPDITVCEGDTVTVYFSMQSNPYGLAEGYDWSGTANSAIGLANVGTSDSISFVATTNGVDVSSTISVVPWVNLSQTSLVPCGGINPEAFVIIVIATPVVDAGSIATICDGDSILLNATGATTYVWDVGVQNGDYYTPGATQIFVTGTDVNGCSAIDSLQIVVNQLPAIGAGSDQTVCLGDSVTLAGTGGTSYLWDNAVFNNQSFVPPVGTTTYEVTGTDANGCENSDQVDVVVNPLPIVDAGLDQVICSGGSITLTGQGAQSYLWDNGVFDNQSFVPTNTGIYTVTGTDGNGCENTDQVLVTVLQTPVVEAGANQTICAGDSVLLNATGADSYTWDIGLQNGDYYTPGPTLIYAMGIGTNGCFSIDSLEITVVPLPTVDAGPDQLVCEGTPITLEAIGNGTVVWNNGVVDGDAFNQTVGTQTYVVELTSLEGCVNTDSVLVVVEPNPAISISSDNQEGCAPLTVLFTNLTQGNLTDCLWEFSNGEISGGCDTVSMTFDTPGYYDVTLTTYTVTGCSNTENFVDYIYVEEDPIASFFVTPDKVTTLHPEIDLTNTSVGATTYSWDFGDESGSTLENPSHTFPDENGGGYVIELIAYSPLMCSDTAYATISVDEELIFYVPNTFTPDGNMYNQTFEPVFASGFDPYDYQLLIFNRWGEQIFESKSADLGWDGFCGMQYCQDGTYTWRIEFKLLDEDERRVVHGHVNIIR